MLSFPLYIFLFLYILFLALFAIFMLINLYHIIATASLTLPSFIISFFIFAAMIFIFYMTFHLIGIAGIDWRERVILFDSRWLGSLIGQSYS